MIKRIILLQTLFFCLFNLNAQEWNNMKLSIEIGLIPFSDSENLGLLFNVEPTLKVSNNAFIGMRVGLTINSQMFENNDNSQFIIDDKSDNGFLSIVPVFGYHWNEKNLRPYLGVGVGPYLLFNYIDVFPIAKSPEEVFEVRLNYQAGFLLRGGLELGKSKLGLEYNFIPKADIKIPKGQKIGTVNSSYLGLYVGFTIGGSKSSK